MCCVGVLSHQGLFHHELGISLLELFDLLLLDQELLADQSMLLRSDHVQLLGLRLTLSLLRLQKVRLLKLSRTLSHESAVLRLSDCCSLLLVDQSWQLLLLSLFLSRCPNLCLDKPWELISFALGA